MGFQGLDHAGADRAGCSFTGSQTASVLKKRRRRSSSLHYQGLALMATVASAPRSAAGRLTRPFMAEQRSIDAASAASMRCWSARHMGMSASQCAPGSRACRAGAAAPTLTRAAAATPPPYPITGTLSPTGAYVLDSPGPGSRCAPSSGTSAAAPLGGGERMRRLMSMKALFGGGAKSFQGTFTPTAARSTHS